MKLKNRDIILLLMLLLGAVSAWGASVHLSVQNGRGRGVIGVGDIFYISYQV